MSWTMMGQIAGISIVASWSAGFVLSMCFRIYSSWSYRRYRMKADAEWERLDVESKKVKLAEHDKWEAHNQGDG